MCIELYRQKGLYGFLSSGEKNLCKDKKDKKKYRFTSASLALNSNYASLYAVIRF